VGLALLTASSPLGSVACVMSSDAVGPSLVARALFKPLAALCYSAGQSISHA
jgi:hypothetical protein